MAKNDKVHYEQASPTLLGEQDPVAPASERPDPDWPALRASLEQRLVRLRNWRQSWWTQNWSDIAEFLLPHRSIWLTQSTGGIPTPNNMTRGRPLNGQIMDSTASLALRVCSSGLMSGLASPSRPWFKLIPGLRRLVLDQAGREWLDETEDRMYTAIAGSNFYNAFAQECEDLVAFGTGVSIIYEDAKDIFRLYNPAIGEYYLAQGATGRVDGLYRMFVFTISEIVDFFGIDKSGKEIQSLWGEKGANLDTERIVAHAIEPNFGVGPKNIGQIKGNFTWRETYWLWGKGTAAPLSSRGFVDDPFTAARWATQSNDAYGRGNPGQIALPDIMQLMVMTRRKAEAVEKQLRPPLIGAMELKNKPSSTLPGHLTYVTDVKNGGIRPIYEVNPDIRGMTEDIMAIEKRIQMALFNDLFLMLEQKLEEEMTAYEVAQKVQEKLQVLGPVIESLISESLKPKLKRIFSIMKRRGMIDPPPPSLQGVPLDVEFVSMLTLAQKGAATGGIERLLQLLGGMYAVFPTVKNLVNAENVVREYSEYLGNPQKILNGPEQVEALNQQDAMKQQQQEQMAATSQAAEAAGKAAPAAQVLADTDVGGGQNVLGKLLGAQ